MKKIWLGKEIFSKPTKTNKHNRLKAGELLSDNCRVVDFAGS